MKTQITLSTTVLVLMCVIRGYPATDSKSIRPPENGNAKVGHGSGVIISLRAA